jgi:hypothetical protein
MPQLKLPNIRLPGFRDMSTDDIKQALADVPRPEVNLADIADAAIAATQAATKAAQEAAAAAQSAAMTAAERTPIKQGRSRRPLLLLGVLAAGVGIFALANAERIRSKAAELGERARERMDAMRDDDSGASTAFEQMGDDVASATGVGIPVRGDAYAEGLPSASATGAAKEARPQRAQAVEAQPTPYGRNGVDRTQDQDEHAEIYRG